jgi:hypothetical protein
MSVPLLVVVMLGVVFVVVMVAAIRKAKDR